MGRGEISTGRKRNSHPQDWCVDESWVAWQLFEALGGFAQEKAAGEIIWDPCCGSGRTMVTFAEAGFPVVMSDIVNRVDASLFDDDANVQFFHADFVETVAATATRPCRYNSGSIVSNFPYSYRKVDYDGHPGMLISEACVRQALRVATRRVCAVFPLKWLASQGRFGLFAQDHPPQAVLVLTQRPSMPPGDLIPALEAEGVAFKGAAVDYAWYIWNVQQPTAPGQTRVIWLPPLDRPDLLKPIEGLA